MLKSYSRACIDFQNAEVAKMIFQMFNLKEASGIDKKNSFEQSFAEYIGVDHAEFFPSCRSGIYYALKALDLNEGDEVIMPAYTFWVDAAMVVLAGLTPVFVDVDFDTHNINPNNIMGAITDKTKVIFPTHLNGFPADMEPIMNIAKKHNLRVIEDTARSCGARYKKKRVGSFDIGVFSFGYGKSFYCLSGGMVTSNDKKFMGRIKEFKTCFSKIPIKNLCMQVLKGAILRYANTPFLYTFSLFPMAKAFQVENKEQYNFLFKIKKPDYKIVPFVFNIEMFNIQAEIANSQLKRIDKTNKIRIKNAQILNKELSGLNDIKILPCLGDRENVYVHYALWSENKEQIQRYLFNKNIDAQNESAEDITQMNAFKKYANGDYPVAKKLNGKVCFIPTHPNLLPEDIMYIANNIKNFSIDRGNLTVK